MTDKAEFQCAANKEHTFTVKKAKLLKVELLEGAEDNFLGANDKQFVNLTRDAKWVDSATVSTIDRLGFKPKIYVEFDLPGVSEFKLKAVAAGSNTEYSDDEKSRNALFKALDEEKTYKTESTGKVIIDDAFISVGGKNKFHFEVEDTQGTKKSTKKLTTHRKVFVQEIKMDGDAGLAAASSISTVVNEFEKHGIIAELMPEKEMPAMENIGPTESQAYINAVKTAYATSDGKQKEPHTIIVGYTSHLAVKNPNKEITKTGVTVGPRESKVVINIAGPGLNSSAIKPRNLWKGLVTGEGWFEEAYFEDAATNVKTPIAEEKCEAIPVRRSLPEKCKKVEIDVSHLPAGRSGKIVIKVNWVDRMRGGLSFRSNNLVCVCTKAWWRNKDSASQNQTIIHEMGHKIGMVPDGTGNAPEKTPTYYDDSKGHVGTHCHHGIPAGQTRYDSSADSAASTCVMYGATNGASAFCSHCAKAAKKQDINSGWSSV